MSDYKCMKCLGPHDGIKHAHDPLGRYCAKCEQRPPYDVLGVSMVERLAPVDARYDIITYSGHMLSFDSPEDWTFDIQDIGHALSNVCRFAGHCRIFYSVAEHSVWVSHNVPPQYALAALLHDGAEAYIGDMSTGLKARFPEYKALEKRIERALFSAYNMDVDRMKTCLAFVKYADLVALATEKRDLMPPTQKQWAMLGGISAADQPIVPLNSAEQACNAFMARYHELANK